MAGWVRLVIACFNFEFPSWGALLCFHIFELSSAESDHGFGDSFREQCMARLCQIFAEDLPTFRDEMNSFMGMAMAEFQKTGRSNSMKAWVRSLFTKDGSGRLRVNEKSPLLRLTAACQSWTGITSSGVEQTLSKAVKVVGSHREQLSESRRFAELKIACDIKPEHKDEVIRRARMIWSETWTAPRLSGSIARPSHFRKKGLTARQKKAIAKKITEAEFVRDRRKKVKEAVAKRAPKTHAELKDSAIASSSSTWTDKQQAAEDELAKRGRHKKAEALVSKFNPLLDDEIEADENLLADADDALKRRTKNDRDADNKKKRENKKLHKRQTDLPSFEDFPVFIEHNNLFPEGELPRNAVADRHKAVMFVTSDVSDLNPRTALSAEMIGGIVCDPLYFESNGQKGTRVDYTPAMNTTRAIYISDPFWPAQPQFTTQLELLLSSDGN